MIRRCCFVLIVSCGLVRPILAETGESNGLTVFREPSQSLIWNTSRSRMVSVAVVCPPGATAGTLDVSSPTGYAVRHEGLKGPTFELDLPSDGMRYDLTLTFDDPGGTSYAASVDVAESVTVRLPGTKKWSRVSGGALIPILPGAESLSVDGAVVALDLGGRIGSYWLASASTGGTALGLEMADGTDYAASLWSVPGLMLIFK